MARLCMALMLVFVILTASARSVTISCEDSPIQQCQDEVNKCIGQPECNEYQLWKDQRCSNSATTNMCCLSYYMKFQKYPKGCSSFMTAFQ